MTSTPSAPTTSDTQPEQIDAEAQPVSETASSQPSTAKQELDPTPVKPADSQTATAPPSTDQSNSEHAADAKKQPSGSESGAEKGKDQSNQSVTPPSAGGQKEEDDDDDDDDDDDELTMNDIRAAVDEIDENIDEAFENAAQSFWRLANTVTGSVSSAVGDAPSLEKLRSNVSSHLKPLDALSQNITSKLESFPNELPDRVANLAGSVKSVAQSVQRNAQQMEMAILSTANATDENEMSNPSADTVNNSKETATTGTDKNIASEDSQSNKPGDATTTTAGSRDVTNTSDSFRHRFDRSAAGLKNVEEEIAKVGATLGKTVGGLWSGLWGSDSQPTGWQRTDGSQILDSSSGKKEPTTRLERKIFELQSDPNTYCEPANDLDAFEQWGKDFNLDNETDECLEILSTHDAIAELYERVVPNIVEEDTFWMRYYFAKHVLMQEEERRKQLLERAESGVQGEEDDGWGDDDWDDDKDDDQGDGETEGKSEGGQAGETDAEKVGEDKQPEGDNAKDKEEGDAVAVKTTEKPREDVEKAKTKDKPEAAVSTMKSGASTNGSGEDDWGDDWE